MNSILAAQTVILSITTRGRKVRKTITERLLKTEKNNWAQEQLGQDVYHLIHIPGLSPSLFLTAAHIHFGFEIVLVLSLPFNHW